MDVTLDQIRKHAEQNGWLNAGRTENDQRVKDTYLTSSGVLIVRLYKKTNEVRVGTY